VKVNTSRSYHNINTSNEEKYKSDLGNKNISGNMVTGYRSEQKSNSHIND
jgi:hypothetical protein